MERGLLGALPEAERQAVRASMVRKTYRRDETLFHEGDPGDQLFAIEKGRVAIRMTTVLGDVVTLNLLGPADTFGEQALLEAGARRTATAIALEPVEVRTLHRDHFDELRRRHPAVDQLLVDLLATQVRRLSASLLEAMYMPVDRRVVRRLAELMNLYDGGSTPVVVPLRQEDLASMVGTTRPTLNRALRQLADDGLIALGRGRVEIHDPIGLAARAR
ncbi:MAG: Crp/Fnr family transcriptional regulator [Acidimicrobiia bacterium]|nr:Crp/Fnr family transcriptional regulator [Acidimicrobiia bacterium]